MTDNQNLWGELPAAPEIKTPLFHMKKQAAVLQELTNGLLAAEIVSQPNMTNQQNFRLVAPTLGNYRAHLFSVQTAVPAYPCVVIDNISNSGAKSARNEAEFLTIIGAVLSSPSVKMLIASLLGQIKGSQTEP